ncbi:MAG: response regulator [Acidimicrobiales bacterium]
MALILIAEDDRRVRESLDRALTLEGYEVVTANDGARALELHGEHRADVLLLDVSMPNVDGLTVCRRVRQAGDDTPILMLTAARGRRSGGRPRCRGRRLPRQALRPRGVAGPAAGAVARRAG